MALKCFVVTPFGDKNSTEQWEKDLAIHIERVYERILRPAQAICAERGVEIAIADGRSLPRSGQILEKIASEIDQADVILVILVNDRKPNVFIELGWAFGAWRRPILLRHGDFDMPSDINNLEYCTYTNADLDAGSANKASEVADRVIELATNGDRKPPTTLLSERKALAKGLISVFNRFSAISFNDWSDMIMNAKERITIATPRLYLLTKQPFTIIDQDGVRKRTRLQALLLRKAIEGVKVTLVMNHEDNPALHHSMVGDESDTIDTVQQELKDAWKVWSQQRQAYEAYARQSNDSSLIPDGFRVIQLHQRYFPFRITMTETRALITLRLFTEQVNSGLCIDAGKLTATENDSIDKGIYTHMQEELDFLIKENEKSSNERFARFSEEFPDLGTGTG